MKTAIFFKQADLILQVLLISGSLLLYAGGLSLYIMVAYVIVGGL